MLKREFLLLQNEIKKKSLNLYLNCIIFIHIYLFLKFCKYIMQSLSRSSFFCCKFFKSSKHTYILFIFNFPRRSKSSIFIFKSNKICSLITDNELILNHLRIPDDHCEFVIDYIGEGLII